jgi:uncharacterized protein YjbI with pentapeptide repeats
MLIHHFFTITEAKVGVFLRSVNAARNSKSSNVRNTPESFSPAIYFNLGVPAKFHSKLTTGSSRKNIVISTLLYATYRWSATLRYSTLLYATLRYSTLLYATLRYSTLLYATLRALLYARYSTRATLRYSTLLYATLRYSTLLYTTLRYSTLEFIDKLDWRRIKFGIYQEDCCAIIFFK